MSYGRLLLQLGYYSIAFRLIKKINHVGLTESGEPLEKAWAFPERLIPNVSGIRQQGVSTAGSEGGAEGMQTTSRNWEQPGLTVCKEMGSSVL